jgi:hypothetical protein
MNNISARALKRRNYRRLNGKSPEARPQITVMGDDGYVTVRYTKGYARISFKRFQARIAIDSLMQANAMRVTAMRMNREPVAPRNSDPAYRKPFARQYA